MPRTTPAAMIVAAALAVTLTACADGAAEDTGTAAAPAPAEDTATQEAVVEDTVEAAPSEEPSEDPSEEAAAGEEAAAAGGSGQELPYDQGLVDDVMGHQVRFTGLVRDFPAPATMEDFDGEILLVRVEATAGETYSGRVDGPFRLTSPDGRANARTNIADDDLAAAGYPPYEAPRSGESATGWISFQANTRSDTYTLEYERFAASVIGSDETIEQKIWEFPVP